MFRKLVSHNDDLDRLLKKGYAIGFNSNCLIVEDIPYLDEKLQLQTGAIVAKLDFVTPEKVRQTDHQIFFAGSVPFGLNQKPIPNLGGGANHFPLTDNFEHIVIERSFSNKPKATGRFEDFYDKIESYVGIISGPAQEKFDATPYTFRATEEIVSDSVFKFFDTLTSRAELTDLALKFKNQTVAIIGLGGTGAYILDFLVKTPIKEIRAFDHDNFHIHNSFRAPGKTEEEEFGSKKAEVFFSRYENFRDNLTFKPIFLFPSCENELEGVSFAFVCVDRGSSRADVFRLLKSLKIPFIDVGMGLDRKKGPINGMARITFATPEDNYKSLEISSAPLKDREDDE